MLTLKSMKEKTGPCVTPLTENSVLTGKDLIRNDRKNMNIFRNYNRFLPITFFSQDWSIEGSKGVKGNAFMYRNYKIFHLWLLFLILIWIQIMSGLELNVNWLWLWINISRLNVLSSLDSMLYFYLFVYFLSLNAALAVSTEGGTNCSQLFC